MLSDGAPMSCGDDKLWQATKDQAARLDADPAFDVFGIGIGDDAVRDFYREHVVLRDINELPRGGDEPPVPIADRTQPHQGCGLISNICPYGQSKQELRLMTTQPQKPTASIK